MNPHIKDRAVLFLEAKLGEVNPVLKKEIADGNIIIRDQKLYVNKNLTVGAGGIVEIVDKTLSVTINSTCFEKGKTEDDTAFGLTGLICRWAPTSAGLDLDQVYSEYIYDYAGAVRIPKEIQNADVQINVGSLKIYEGRLANLFVNGREARENGESYNYLRLKAPKFIKGGQDVQITVRMQNAKTLTGTAAHNGYFQFEFDGAATSIKM